MHLAARPTHEMCRNIEFNPRWQTVHPQAFAKQKEAVKQSHRIQHVEQDINHATYTNRYTSTDRTLPSVFAMEEEVIPEVIVKNEKKLEKEPFHRQIQTIKKNEEFVNTLLFKL